MFQTGYKFDADALAESVQRMEAGGHVVSFASGQATLKGYWKRLVSQGITAVLLQEFETIVWGGMRPAFHQETGSCVSMGTARAIADSYYARLAVGEIGRPVMIATEPIYAGSRVEIGRGSLGRGAGSQGCWGAEWVARYGVLARGKYGNIDLTTLRDDLADDWGMPRVGCPDILESKSKEHIVPAAHQCQTVGDIADAIAARFGVAFCSNTLWQDPNADNRRGKGGMCRPVTDGGHCEEVCGVFLLPNGDTGFVRQQSWGNQPHDNDELETAGGRIRLREGSYGAFYHDIESALAEGEAWCFQSPNPWTEEES